MRDIKGLFPTNFLQISFKALGRFKIFLQISFPDSIPLDNGHKRPPQTSTSSQPTDRAAAGCQPRGSRPQRHVCRSGRMRRLQAGFLPRGAQGAGVGRGRAGRTWPAARRRLHGKLTARPPTATACRGYRPSTGQLRWPLGPRRLCIPCSNLHRQGLLALERRARLMACASAGPRLDSCPVPAERSPEGRVRGSRPGGLGLLWHQCHRARRRSPLMGCPERAEKLAGGGRDRAGRTWPAASRLGSQSQAGFSQPPRAGRTAPRQANSGGRWGLGDCVFRVLTCTARASLRWRGVRGAWQGFGLGCSH